MNTVFLIVGLLFPVGMLLIILIEIKNPHNTLVKLLFSWQYRMLLEIRQDYLRGLKKTPPDDYQFFYDNALNLIEAVDSSMSHREEAWELGKMLQVKQFIHHYFVNEGRFSGAVYHCMHTDYRSGIYRMRDYDLVEHLKKKLPVEISSNKQALSGFLKFVDVGWFDNEGMFVLTNTRNHQYIGRAIYWICKRNGIPAPEKVFAPFWNVKESQILDWKRNNKNPEITKAIDQIVCSILA